MSEIICLGLGVILTISYQQLSAHRAKQKSRKRTRYPEVGDVVYFIQKHNS